MTLYIITDRSPLFHSHPRRDKDRLEQHATNDLFDFNQQLDEDQSDIDPRRLQQTQQHQSIASDTIAEGENGDSGANVESDDESSLR